MKAKNTLLLLLVVLFFAKPHRLMAQETKLPPLNFTVNAGIGFTNLSGMYYQSQGTGSNNGSYSPIYVEAGYNYSKHGLVSLYLSSAAGTTGNFTFDTAKGSQIFSYSYYVSVFTLGLSTKYYFSKGTHFEPYVGCMLGYTFVNFIEEGEFPAFGAANVNVISLAYHVYVGSCYYFNNWLGLNARIGYGNNYYGSIGLTFKFQVKQDAD